VTPGFRRTGMSHWSQCRGGDWSQRSPAESGGVTGCEWGQISPAESEVVRDSLGESCSQGVPERRKNQGSRWELREINGINGRQKESMGFQETPGESRQGLSIVQE
jgi:hypothetical protein